MFKRIGKILKKVILAIVILYGYNIMASPLNIIVPINFMTIGIITVLGIPALFSLIVINLLIF